jgi:hypothetical protein
MGERNLMRKRITLLIAALMLALTMSFSGVAFADPDCDQVTNNKHCEVTGLGGSADSQGQAQEKTRTLTRPSRVGSSRVGKPQFRAGV